MFYIQLRRFKKSSEETVHCGQVYENSPLKMKNFDIRLPCDSHNGTHSMNNTNKECQDLTTVEDATQCYHDMRMHHTTYAHSFQIMKVEGMAADKLCRFAVSSSRIPKLSSHCHKEWCATSMLHYQETKYIIFRCRLD